MLRSDNVFETVRFFLKLRNPKTSHVFIKLKIHFISSTLSKIVVYFDNGKQKLNFINL